MLRTGDKNCERGEFVMFKRRKQQVIPYEKTGKIPVIRASICTREQVAGFRVEATGKFEELMLVRSRRDLEEFMRQYDVREKEIKREW